MMEQHWERRHPFVALEEQTISSMLHPAFPRKQLASFELLAAGKCNTNYTFTFAGSDERFVLRLYVRDKQACQKDSDLFHLIHKCVPVPDLLYTHISDQNANDSDPRNIASLTYSIMKWVDGELFSDVLERQDTKAIPDCAYDIGRVLATIGGYTFPHSGFFGSGLTIAEPLPTGGRDMILSFLEWCLFQQHADRQLGPMLTERLWQFVNEHAAYLDVLDNAASLVHSDYKGMNILVQNDHNRWHVSAVLDWEFAFAGSPFFDIGNMLRFDYLHPANYSSEFIRGYQDHGGQLPAHWKKTARLVDLTALCEFMTNPQSRGVMSQEIPGLIARTMEQWNNLDQD
jgi:aminoglycoside phosphotransferase (APT) family kinase protein